MNAILLHIYTPIVWQEKQTIQEENSTLPAELIEVILVTHLISNLC